MSQNIRLRFSGLTLFASKALSVVTGFIFVIAVTRNISSNDFGVWQNIGDMVGYFVIFSNIVPGWVTRYVARGQENSATTGFLTNLVLSSPFIVAWILLAPQFAKIADAPTLYYTLAFLMISGSYLKPALEAIAQARSPYLLGVDVVIHESTMVSIGVTLVMLLKFGLIGALVTVILSNFVDVLFYIVALRGSLGWKTNWGYVRSWLKASTISVYGMIGDRLGASTLVLLMIYSGATARAYYGAAYAIAVSMYHVSSLAIGLYPKLLAGGTGKDVETSLKLMLMFAIPMIAGAIVLAKPLLAILNPDYEVAAPVLYLMMISFLPYCLNVALDSIITGTETVDRTAFKMKALLRSRLSLPASLTYVSSLICVPLVYFVLTNLKPSPLEAALYVVAIGYVPTPLLLIIRYIASKRYMTFKLPMKESAKYVVASITMTAALIWLPVQSRISIIIPIVMFGGGVYFATLLIIDRETRKLLGDILAELRKMNNSRRNILQVNR